MKISKNRFAFFFPFAVKYMFSTLDGSMLASFNKVLIFNTTTIKCFTYF